MNWSCHICDSAAGGGEFAFRVLVCTPTVDSEVWETYREAWVQLNVPGQSDQIVVVLGHAVS